MTAQIFSLASEGDPHAMIVQAAKALAAGALVAFPTETVYGLAANAANETSMGRLRAVKAETQPQSYAIHIANRSDCEAYVPDLSPLARRLAKKGWPGPMTLVFPVPDPSVTKIYDRLSSLGRECIYGEKTVSIRCPDNPIASEFLAATDSPVVAPSANRSGQPAPIDAASVEQQIGADIDFILDGGATRYRKASTIVSVNGSQYRVIRPGVLDERTIKRFASIHILFICTGNTCRSPMAEGMFKQMVAEKLGCTVGELPERGIHIRSAGTMAFTGGPASREAVEVSKKRGIDLSHHAARSVDPELIHPADYIFSMGRHHIDVLRAISPADAGRAMPLDPDSDISDPAGGSIEDYEQVAAKIHSALKRRLQEMTL